MVRKSLSSRTNRLASLGLAHAAEELLDIAQSESFCKLKNLLGWGQLGQHGAAEAAAG
jgi:hypothetical protein